jgi:hypothetical protein
LFPVQEPNGTSGVTRCPSSRRSSPAKAVAPRADHSAHRRPVLLS